MELKTPFKVTTVGCLFLFQLQNKEEGSSYRESSYTETPDTPKVTKPFERIFLVVYIIYFRYGYYLTAFTLQRGMDQDRTFIPDSVSFGGNMLCLDF